MTDTLVDFQDVMQVCRNGHVITDLLHTHPEQCRPSCDRCGAATLDRCLTCGQELAGAIPVPGLTPVGHRRPPQYCSACGASFPWTVRPAAGASTSLAVLEQFLRRVPETIRQLRSRQTERPAFLVVDQRDLEDLLRAVLPLCAEEVRPHRRTPRYAAGNRTDLLIVPASIALTAKLVEQRGQERDLGEQWQEDIAYYQGPPNVRALVGFVYDPQGLLADPRLLQTIWSKGGEELETRCVIAG